MVNNIFSLKVFQNKRNGQLSVALPKKLLEKCPDNVQVKIPKKFMQKEVKTEKWW